MSTSTFLTDFQGKWPRPRAEYRNAIQSYAIVIDTNVLLDLYRFTPKARLELLDVLHSVQQRLWVPHQVAREYFARRIDALKDQLDLYDSVPRELKTLHDKAITQVNTFARRCSLPKKDKDALIEPLREALEKVTNEIKRHQKDLDLSLAKVASNDPVLDALAKLLDGRTGTPFSADEETKLIEDYSTRAAAKMPPGYKDSGKGDNAHGDFFVWEQMIRRSTEKEMPTLFITSDVKEDWFQRMAGIPIGARPELIAEMRERSNTDFLIMQLSTFLREAKDALGAEVSDDTYEAAKNVALESPPKESATLFAMPRSVYATLKRQLRNEVDQAVQAFNIAKSQDAGKPRSLDNAIKSRLIEQTRSSAERSLSRLDTFESCTTQIDGDYVEITVDDKATARMIEALMREAEHDRVEPKVYSDKHSEKGSTIWLNRLERAIAPYVDNPSIRSLSDDSITLHVSDISEIDADAIRGLAKSFDIDIHLFAKNGLHLTAWSRR